MSTYKHLSDLIKICSVLPALAVMPAVAADQSVTVNNPADVENWSNNSYSATNKNQAGGILKIPSGDSYANVDVDAGVVENNSISLSKTDGYESEVFGQGSVIYSNGALGSITGTFNNNSVSNSSDTASKATANGGVFALYAGTDIKEINGDFSNNSVSATYAGDGETQYTSGSQISAGGGAMHIEGQYGPSAVNIGKIVGDFSGNSATGDGYANGGAIYIKGGADREGQQGYGVTIGSIVGDFTNNKVVATTATSENKKASTGGAISIKNATENVKGASVSVDGNFANNSVSTNGTDALGGAIYNEGFLTINGNFSGNSAKSESGKSFGGAIYNTGEIVNAAGNYTNNSATTAGGAIYNAGTIAITSEEGTALFGANSSGIGGAIYNADTGHITDISHASFQKNYGTFGGAINNSNLTGNVGGGVIDRIANASFIENSAGGNQGGAIRNQGKIGTIENVAFISNTAGNGGAINNGSLGVIDKINASFSSNLALNGGVQQGGAIVNAGVIESITDSSFTGNQAGKLGGAILNETNGKITFNGTNTFAGNIANGVANDIHNKGQIIIADGTTTLGGGVTGSGILTVADGATLSIGSTTLEQGTLNLDGTLSASIVNQNAFGKIKVDNINVGENGLFDLMLGAAGTYDFGTNISVDNIAYNDVIYNVSVDGTNIIVQTKDVEEVAKTAEITTDASVVLVGLANSNDYAMNIASLNAQSALEAGNKDYIETETAKLRAEDKPVAQSVATSVQNQVLSVAANRMEGGNASIGRSGGDLEKLGYGIWAQGLVNKAKYSDKFTGDTSGISAGIDALIDGKFTVGIGYAHNETDVDAKLRDVEIASDSVFLYGQYKPNKWYLNGTFNYTMANYTESTTAFGITVNPEYDVDSFGGQIMTGYAFASGFVPEVGARYLHISQDNYNNGLADISGTNTDFLTGVAGMKYGFTIEAEGRLKFRPELRAAATYDFISDEAVAFVTVPGAASYRVTGENLSRLGGEFGIGLSAMYNDWVFSINYDLDLHEDYTSQTGMLKFRYTF